MELENFIHSRLDAAWRFYGQGNTASAAEFARQVLAQDPRQPSALLLLGYCALLKDDKEAEDHGRTLLANDPTWAQAHLLMGHVMNRSRKEPVTAERHFRDAIRYGPECGTFYAALGTFLGGRGRIQEGITVARKGLKADPDDLAVLEALQGLYRLDNDLEMAQQFGDRALELAPNRSVQHLEAGLRLLEGFERQRSRGNFLEALRLAPEDVENREMIAHERVRTHPFYRHGVLLSLKPGILIATLLVPAVWYALSWLIPPFIWLSWISAVVVVGWCLYSSSFYLCRWWVRRQIEAGRI